MSCVAVCHQTIFERICQPWPFSVSNRPVFTFRWQFFSLLAACRRRRCCCYCHISFQVCTLPKSADADDERRRRRLRISPIFGLVCIIYTLKRNNSLSQIHRQLNGKNGTEVEKNEQTFPSPIRWIFVYILTRRLSHCHCHIPSFPFRRHATTADGEFMSKLLLLNYPCQIILSSLFFQLIASLERKWVSSSLRM